MEKNGILARPFIKDISKGKVFYCNPDISVVVFPEDKLVYLCPYGEASQTYNKELNLICPIQKIDGSVILMPDTVYVHTAYHKSQKKIMESIIDWYQLPTHITITGNIPSPIDLPYEAMDVLSLESYLTDWLTICEDNKRKPVKVEEVLTIKKVFLKKIETETNKQTLIETWNNVEVSLNEFNDESTQALLHEIHQSLSNRLLTLGSRKASRNAKDKIPLEESSLSDLKTNFNAYTKEEFDAFLSGLDGDASETALAIAQYIRDHRPN